MTQTKFTPAPWKAEFNGHYYDINQGNIKTYNHIASTDSWIDSHDRELTVREVEMANAALIACAPELYRMLEEVLYGQVAPEDIEQLLKKARGE